MRIAYSADQGIDRLALIYRFNEWVPLMQPCAQPFKTKRGRAEKGGGRELTSRQVEEEDEKKDC